MDCILEEEGPSTPTVVDGRRVLQVGAVNYFDSFGLGYHSVRNNISVMVFQIPVHNIPNTIFATA